jgi:transcriptional regulator with XRE-family HTH domain
MSRGDVMNKRHFIGKKLKQLRIEKQYTLIEVTKGFMSPAKLSMIENGKQNISQKHLSLLLNKLNVPEEEFSLSIESKTNTKTKDELKLITQLVYKLQFEDIGPIISRMDFTSMDKEMRVVYLYYKSLYALNHFNKEMLTDINQEMNLFHTEDIASPLYYIYWRFKANFLSFYGNQKESITINNMLLQLNYCPINPLIYTATYTGLTRSFTFLEDYPQALRYSEKDCDFLKSSNQLRYFLCDNLLAHAGLLYKVGDFIKQEKLLFESLEVAKSLNSPNLLGKALYNLGEFYYLQYNPIKAVQYWKDSLIYKRRSGQKTSIFTSLRALSEYYLREQQFELSNLYIKEGLERSQKLDHTQYYYIFKLLYARYLFETGLEDLFIREAKECERYYQSSQRKNIDITLQDQNNPKQLFQMVGKYYLKKKKYKKAGDYFSKIDISEKIPL